MTHPLISLHYMLFLLNYVAQTQKIMVRKSNIFEERIETDIFLK